MTKPRRVYYLVCFECVYKRESNKPKGNCPKCKKKLKVLGSKPD